MKQPASFTHRLHGCENADTLQARLDHSFSVSRVFPVSIQTNSRLRTYLREPTSLVLALWGWLQDNKCDSHTKGFQLRFLVLKEHSSAQFSSVTQLCLTLWDPVNCSTPGLPIHHQLLELAQIPVHWVGDAIQPYHPLSSPSPPDFNLSQHQGLFQSIHHIRWPKYWSFNISPLNEYSGLISFRIDWFDLLAVQGILKSLLQHHNSKASILWHSVFLTVQLSHHCRSVHHYWENRISDYLDLY